MKKILLLLALLGGGITSQAQTAPVETTVSSSVASAYRTLADTTKQFPSTLSKGNKVRILNTDNPRWTLVRFGSTNYYVRPKDLHSETVAPPPLALAMGDVRPQTEQYCLLMATATTRLLSPKVTITLDYGQETGIWANNDNRIKDETGRVQAFNSIVDALNYMNSRGWEFVNAYVLPVQTQNVYHYLMRRRVQ